MLAFVTWQDGEKGYSQTMRVSKAPVSEIIKLLLSTVPFLFFLDSKLDSFLSND